MTPDRDDAPPRAQPPDTPGAALQGAAASAELFQLLVDSVKDYAIFMLDRRGRVATWNRGAERIEGYRADEILGHHVSIFYPPADVAAGKCAYELEIATRTGRFEEEGWRVRKDGSRFWASVVLSAVHDPAGALIGYAKVTRDLSERRDAASAWTAQEQRFRLLVESVRDYGIFMLDPGGHVATWNQGAERIKGYRADEIIGRHFATFYPEVDVRAGKCEHELAVAAREGRFEDEGWRVRKDGSQFWANVVITALRDDRGALVGFGKVTRDLTERVRVEDERARRLAAEQASRTKDEFLAMLGHELRNPLAPIVSALQLLELRGDARSTREHQIIARQVGQMIHLVDDLLDVSRVSSGKIALARREIDLRDALARAAETVSPAFARHGQHVTVAVPAHPLIVDGDDARLVQVFANLLTNASKYTPDGGHIDLRVRHVEREIVVEVEDDGRGIEPALLPRIFELFVQGYQDVDRPDGGLGVGLTLVRSLVHLHGGEVEAHSRGRGQGSRFVVRLPAREAYREEGAPEAARAASEGPSVARRGACRVLVVDDNEDAREMLAEMLVALGHEAMAAGDGPEALRVLERFRPDLAILDIGLPGMDGYALATRIRALPGGDALRLIALSGYGQPDDRAAGARAGFDAYLVKPVDVARLQAEVAASRRG